MVVHTLGRFGLARLMGRLATVAVLLLVVTLFVGEGPASADTTPVGCADDPFPFYTPTGPAQARVCITDPTSGPVSGIVTVTATLTNIGQPTVPQSQFAARRMVFTLDGQNLLTDYEAEPRATVADPSVYTFRLTTSRWVDGEHVLRAHAVMGDTLKGPYPSPTIAAGRETTDATVSLTFQNGITVVPPNTRTFTPATGTRPAPGAPFVMAATGDGAGGEPEADAVVDRIASWNPNLFLYLGDVYEDGTATEFENWYGTDGQRWSRFRAITNPVVGNHEYQAGTASGYFDYWDNIPNYYSYNAGGWHFVNLDSNGAVDQQPGSPQYEWLKADLAASGAACTVAAFHHPLFTVGAQGPAPRMSAIWDLMAQMGVDVVLTGHDHNYQRWAPLGAGGTADPMGMTEFVAGAGGHGIRPFSAADPRMVVGYDTTPQALGGLRFELGADRAGFEYVNTAGVISDSGQVLCERSPYAVDSPRHDIYLARDRLRRLLAGGAAPAATLTSAIGHLDKAEADVLWDSDWRPATVNGQVVLDEMKKSVGDLKTIASAAPQVPTTMNQLLGAGQRLAQEGIDDAVARFGSLDKVAKARTLLGEGLQRKAVGDAVGALDKFKQAFQEARDGLAAAPDPWVPGDGIRGRIGQELAVLYGVYPTGTGDDARIKGAVGELGKALDLVLWQGQSRPLKKDVFDHLKKAEAQLMDVRATDVSGSKAAIGAAARSIAVNTIDEAVARNGSTSKIGAARSKLAEADAKVANGKYDEAMDRFRDSWLNALSA